MAYKVIRSTGDYRLYLTLTKGTPNIAGNYTPVTVRLYLYKNTGTNWSGLYATDSRTWSWSGSGITSRSGSYVFDFRSPKDNYGEILLRNETFNVAHNSDGSRGNLTVSATVNFAHTSIANSVSISESVSFTTIPRASSFTLGGSTQTGSAITVSISRASTSFTHRVRWRVGSGSWTTVSSNATTSASFTVPHSAFPNNTSGTITVAVQTYSGSTAIGNEQTRTRTLTVPESIVPDFTTVTHSEYVSVVNTAIGEYVQNKSRLNLAITGAVAGDGASIKSYKITVDGQTANAQSGTTEVIRNSGNLNIVGTVTDSRNRSTSKTAEITVLPYQEPTLESIGLTRATSTGVQDPFGTFARLNIKARVSSLNDKNTATYQVRSRVAPSGAWSTKTSTTSIGVSESKTHTYSGYAVTDEYQFEIVVTDKLGSQTIMNDLLFLSTGGVPFFVGYDGIASSFGKIPTHGTTYDLEIGEKGLRVDGPIIDKNGGEVLASADYVIETGSNSRGSWEKWKSGKLIQKGEVAFSVAVNGAWGALFDGMIPRVTYPIPFLDGTIAHFKPAFVTSSRAMMISASSGASNIRGPAWYLVHVISIAIEPYVVGWEAEGTWK